MFPITGMICPEICLRKQSLSPSEGANLNYPMGIHLSEDGFADHLNIQNHGFIAVLDPGSTSSGMQGQKPGGETGIQSGGSVLPADKEPEADKSRDVTASGLLGLMIKSSL